MQANSFLLLNFAVCFEEKRKDRPAKTTVLPVVRFDSAIGGNSS